MNSTSAKYSVTGPPIDLMTSSIPGRLLKVETDISY